MYYVEFNDGVITGKGEINNRVTLSLGQKEVDKETFDSIQLPMTYTESKGEITLGEQIAREIAEEPPTPKKIYAEAKTVEEKLDIVASYLWGADESATTK